MFSQDIIHLASFSHFTGLELLGKEPNMLLRLPVIVLALHRHINLDKRASPVKHFPVASADTQTTGHLPQPYTAWFKWVQNSNI